MVPVNTVPIWLLEFDGVVNVIQDHPPTRIYPADTWIYTEDEFQGKVWPILASTVVLDFIRQMHEEGLADIRWHTTWQEEAHRVGEKLNLPKFPIEPAPEFRGSPVKWSYSATPWWKLPAVWRLLNLGYRVLWTDDDIDFELSHQQRLALRTSGCRPICPDTDAGLETHNLQEIERYLRTIARLTPPDSPGTVAVHH